MSNRFSKLPTWWVRKGKQAQGLPFRAGSDTGISIAGLKCLIALSLRANFHSMSVQIPLSKLEDLCGLSKPMVMRGLKFLVEKELIAVDKTTHTHTYKILVDSEDRGWAKVPYRLVHDQLPTFSNRGPIFLLALKIYVLLLAFRPNDEESFPFSYDSIVEYTNCQRNQVRKALDLLTVRGLIRCYLSTGSLPKNIYEIKGL